MGFLKHLLRGDYNSHYNKHKRRSYDSGFDEPNVIVRCTKCGKNNAEKASFCQHCGEPLGKVKCKSCEEPMPVEGKFCPNCGSKN